MNGARGDGTLAHRYEAIFCVFMAGLLYLARGNSDLVFPQVLYFFGLLLALNLGAGLSLRLWPTRAWLSASAILSNCAAITGILAYSGGPGSTLWVLYLLPIYTVCLLLGGREVFWITAGACAFNAAFYALSLPALDAAAAFEIATKSGVMVLAAALTWRLVSSERGAGARLDAQRAELEALGREHQRAAGLAEVGLSSAGIAHDLGTPLMIIYGYAKICLDAAGADSPLRKDLETIRRAAVFCQKVAADMLCAAKSQPIPAAAFDLHEALAAAADFCAELPSGRLVSIERRFEASSSRVVAVRERLERLFMNLLANAAKAMPAGGRIVLATACAPGAVRVTVDDEGAGIPDEVMRKLFTPFNTSRPAAGGNGLGLYLARTIVQEHGGTIAAERRAGGGTRFTVVLPLAGGDADVSLPARIASQRFAR